MKVLQCAQDLVFKQPNWKQETTLNMKSFILKVKKKEKGQEDSHSTWFGFPRKEVLFYFYLLNWGYG